MFGMTALVIKQFCARLSQVLIIIFQSPRDNNHESRMVSKAAYVT